MKPGEIRHARVTGENPGPILGENRGEKTRGGAGPDRPRPTPEAAPRRRRPRPRSRGGAAQRPGPGEALRELATAGAARPGEAGTVQADALQIQRPREDRAQAPEGIASPGRAGTVQAGELLTIPARA